MKAVIVDVAMRTGQSMNQYPVMARAAPTEGARCPIPVNKGRNIKLTNWSFRYPIGFFSLGPGMASVAFAKERRLFISGRDVQ